MNNSCPFCGKTKLKVDSKKGRPAGWVDGEHLFYYVVSVRCNCCHARGPSVSIKIPESSTNAVELCEEAAFKAWNNRC